MKKALKVFSLLLSIVFVLSAFPVFASAESAANDWEYEVISGTKIQLTKYVGTATVVDIPSTITDGETTYEVVKLGNSLFAGTAEGTGSTVTSVTIPSNVLYTGTNIFLDNTNLTTLVINSNGIELSNQFARGTTNLTTVTINGYVKSLGTAAFLNTKVSTLVFPEGLTSVADYALKSYYITDITIPSSIATATGDNVLYGAGAADIRRITIRVPDTKTEAFVRTNFKWNMGGTTPTVFYGPMVIGDGFESNPALWKSGDVTGTVEGHAVRSYIGSSEKAVIPTYDWAGIAIDCVLCAQLTVKTLMIPETVNLHTKMFQNNSYIENLICNADVAAEYAFLSMQALKTLEVNGTVSKNFAFVSCPLLETATISDLSGAPQNIFHNNTELTTVTLNGTVPEAADSSGSLIHNTCSKLTKIIFGPDANVTGTSAAIIYQLYGVANRITEIDIYGTINKDAAFCGFSALETVRIYKTSNVAGNNLFWKDYKLKNIWFEEGTTFGAEGKSNYFRACTSLTDVTISAGTTIIGAAVFNECSALRNVILCEGCKCSGSLLYNLTNVKNIIVKGACQVNLGLGAANVHYYLTDWFEGLSLSGASAATVHTVYINDGDILTDIGEDMMSIQREGKVFCGFVCSPKDGQEYAGKMVDYNYVVENNLPSDFVQVVTPKFANANIGDVDANGVVNIIDLIHYKKQLADSLYPIFFADKLADTNDDGVINSGDLAVLRQILLKNTNIINETLASRYTFAENVTSSDKIPTSVTTLYEYDENWAFAHIPHIKYFNGKFYAFWEVGVEGEDCDGQYIMWSYSEDAEIWEEPMTLSAAQYATGDLTKIVQYTSGFSVVDGSLYADYAIHTYDKDGTILGTFMRAKLADDGVSFEEPILSDTITGSYMNSIYSNGYYYKTSSTGVRISSDGMTWYNRGLTNEQVALAKEQGAELCEAVVYTTSDMVYHLLMRGQDGYIWHATSLDRGLSWSNPVKTAMKNADSKFCIGQIQTGDKAGYYYIISNIENSGTQDRNPLYISLSIDGYEFDEVYQLENDAYSQNKPGIGKGGAYAYPSCAEYVDSEDGKTYFAVIYSCGKEEIRVSTFTFDS